MIGDGSSMVPWWFPRRSPACSRYCLVAGDVLGDLQLRERERDREKEKTRVGPDAHHCGPKEDLSGLSDSLHEPSRALARSQFLKKTHLLWFALHDWRSFVQNFSETARKNCPFGGYWGQRGKSSKNAVFPWEAPWQYKFDSTNFIVETLCCHCAGS